MHFLPGVDSRENHWFDRWHELEFYKNRISENFGISVLVPELHDRQMVHDVIYRESCLDPVEPESREVYLAIIGRRAREGIDGVILGCTEIGMLIEQRHTEVRLYDRTAIHAQQAVARALE